jgi:hypothetical protein
MRNNFHRLFLLLLVLNLFILKVNAYTVVEDPTSFQEVGLRRYSILADPLDTKQTGVQLRLKVEEGKFTNFSQTDLLTIGTCTAGTFYNSQQICADIVNAHGFKKNDLLGKFEITWDNPNSPGIIKYDADAAYFSDTGKSELKGVLLGNAKSPTQNQAPEYLKIICLAGLGVVGLGVIKKEKKILFFGFIVAIGSFFIILSPQPTLILPETGSPLSTEQYNKKVMVLIWNPTMKNGKKLVTDRSWSSPTELTASAVAWFKNVTNGRLNYTIQSTQEIDDFTTLTSSRKYTSQTFEDCTKDSTKCFKDGGSLAMLDYTKVINSYDVCSKVNAGLVDEVWLFGGPYFGFYESTLTGPSAKLFNYNDGGGYASTCSKLVPIMGFNYERSLNEVVHDFGHRSERTFNKVWGWLNTVTPKTNWDLYGDGRREYYNQDNTPPYGCGVFHYPPNTLNGYQYDDSTSIASYCSSFDNYPDLSGINSPTNITSAAWGSSDIGFYDWWFRHLPNKSGCNTDQRLNDWWAYVVDPNMASQTCSSAPITSPSVTPSARVTITPTLTPQNIECGLIDTNTDNILNVYDLINFSRVYQKACSDNAPQTGCGGKDTNADNRVNISDFIYFAHNYYTIKSSCLR